MKRGIQLKQLNKRDLNLLGLPETILQQSATDQFGTPPEATPLEPGLPPDLLQAVREELEDTLRLLQQVLAAGAEPVDSPATDPLEGQGTDRKGEDARPPEGL
jgi:hypothetical protein